MLFIEMVRPEGFEPPTLWFVARTIAFDINYGCSGYIYGLYQAALLITSKSAQRVLVCVGDTISRFLAPDDHKVRLVLGDGGSATIVESGIDEWAFDINTDGSGFDKLIVPKENHRDGYLILPGKIGHLAKQLF